LAIPIEVIGRIIFVKDQRKFIRAMISMGPVVA
jgi:hypothetical protein